MTINQLKSTLIQQLAGIYPAGEVESLHRHLVSHCCGIDFSMALRAGQTEANDEQCAQYLACAHRLAANEPLQYIVGYTDFYDCRLSVSSGVLIPRPETEELVHHIAAVIGLRPARVLDIGTGSGCIAVALARSCPAADVHAVDISEDALRIAAENARTNHARVTFAKQDILGWQSSPVQDAPWDIIVSNPPYILHEEQQLMHDNVLQHEPHLALFVPNDDPLLFYRAIAGYAAQSLCPGGKLFVEINERFATETAAMLDGFGFSEVLIFKDMQDKDRWMSCQK